MARAPRIETPATVRELQVEKFRAFLTARGAELLIPTNPYEVIRFRALGDVHVIYRKQTDRITMPKVAIEAWKAFRVGAAWSGMAQRVKNGVKRSVMSRTLIERDGPGCFYCGEEMLPEGNDGDGETVEHLLSLAHGGSNHISNLVLAHKRCNEAAGHLSVMEKIAIREKARTP